MRAMLIGSAGPLIGREFSLDEPVTTIGRRDENHIVIKDPTVSRKHAEIRQEGDDLILRDNGSTSGTVVNGAPLTGEHRLRDGDTIVIGSAATFTVQMHPDDSATIAFPRDQLPSMRPVSPPSGQDAQAAASSFREAGHTSMMPAIEPPSPPSQAGNEPPLFGGAPPRAPEQPAGGFGAQGGFGPPPGRPETPAPGGWNPPPPPAFPGSQAPPSSQSTLHFEPPRPAGNTPPPPNFAPPGGNTPPPPSFGPPGGSAPPTGFAPPGGNTPPPPNFAPPGGNAQAPSFGAAPAFPPPANQPPAFGAPPGPQAMAAPPRPPAAAAGRKRGPLVGIIIGLIVLIIIAIVVIVLVAKKVTSADLAPTANLALPLLAAVVEAML
ncbi:MAG TPA: FHA domain-containing protein [Thermomicrobiales bacterium]|nr:FHA domain-containing protein [Thermomicrobiales bacterium]